LSSSNPIVVQNPANSLGNLILGADKKTNLLGERTTDDSDTSSYESVVTSEDFEELV
jgi:hypothetical protein